MQRIDAPAGGGISLKLKLKFIFKIIILKSTILKITIFKILILKITGHS